MGASVRASIPNKQRRLGPWLVLLVPLLAFGGLWFYFRSNPAKPKISLYEAVLRHDADAIAWHVRAGASLDTIVAGHTALYRAASNADLNSVRALLDAGASPNAEIKGKSTPLQAAASAGSLDCVKALIAAGAKVDAANASGSTALHSAASGGNPEIVRLLLDKGLPIDARRSVDHATPLCDAASQGRLDCVKLLLDRGAKIDISGFSGRTPLSLSILTHRRVVARELLDRGSDASKPDDAGVMPLGYALFVGDTDLVKALIPKTNPITWRDRAGKGALYWADEGRAPQEVVNELKRLGCTK